MKYKSLPVTSTPDAMNFMVFDEEEQKAPFVAHVEYGGPTILITTDCVDQEIQDDPTWREEIRAQVSELLKIQKTIH